MDAEAAERPFPEGMYLIEPVKDNYIRYTELASPKVETVRSLLAPLVLIRTTKEGVRKDKLPWWYQSDPEEGFIQVYLVSG